MITSISRMKLYAWARGSKSKMEDRGSAKNRNIRFEKNVFVERISQSSRYRIYLILRKFFSWKAKERITLHMKFECFSIIDDHSFIDWLCSCGLGNMFFHNRRKKEKSQTWVTYKLQIMKILSWSCSSSASFSLFNSFFLASYGLLYGERC